MRHTEDQHKHMFQRMADKCVGMAKLETNEASKLALLAMAQKWRDLAVGGMNERWFDQLHDEFNGRQMGPNVIKGRGAAA